MTAVALLKKKRNPTDKDIDEAMTNICRCGTYARIRTAIHAVAKTARPIAAPVTAKPAVKPAVKPAAKPAARKG